MPQKHITASTVFELILSIALIILSFFLATSDTLTLPGRLTTNFYTIKAPATYFVAGSVFVFACSLALLTLRKNKFKSFCLAMFCVSFLLFIYGFYFH